MRRKILGFLVAICMVVTMVPVSAFAETTVHDCQFGVRYDTEWRGEEDYAAYDSFKVTLPEKGFLKINSKKPESQAFYGGPYTDACLLKVYDESGSDLIWYHETSDGEINSAAPEFKANVGLEAGTYYVKVELVDSSIYHREGTTKGYVMLDFQKADYCEIENNDNSSCATNMEFNHFYKGYRSDDDCDFYKFRVKKGRQYMVSVKDCSMSLSELIFLHSFPLTWKEFDKIDLEGNPATIFTAEEDGFLQLCLYGDYEPSIEKYSIKVSTYIPKAPENFEAKLSRAAGGYDDVNLSWSPSENAAGYKVYYKKSTAKNYTLLRTVNGTSTVAKNLADGVKYNFSVCPYYYDENDQEKLAKASYASTYTLKKVATPTVRKYKSNYVNVKWTNIPGESGYQISKAKSKTGTYIVTNKNYKASSAVVKATNNRGYYYKVRAYKIINIDGNSYKVFAPWSNAKYYRG